MFEPDQASPQLSLQLANDEASGWVVRESPRARRLSVKVLRTGRVEVIVPRRVAAKTVSRFVEQHRNWIEQKRAEALRNAVPPQPFPPARLELTACGETWRIHLAAGRGRPRVRELAPGVLGIRGDAGETRLLKQALRRWLMSRACGSLAPVLETTARETGMRYTKMVIRRQRSRWGSCSTRGTLSLNCCLMFQRPAVVRYLLVHELAHTQHMNHSKRFWQCVARHCPDFRELDAQLLAGWRRVPAWVFS